MERQKQISIAIADDFELLRGGLTLAVNSFNNCKVTIIAKDGIDLLEQIGSAISLPDICLLDIGMPRMNGYDTLVEIKKRWPDLKVIILTIHYFEYTIIKTLRDGASSCLPKEISNDQLKIAIEEVYRTGVYHDNLVSKLLTNSLKENAKKLMLSEPEIKFLRHCCSDNSYKEIAVLMNVGHRTIDSYRDSLFAKLEVTSRAALVVFALQVGLQPFR